MRRTPLLSLALVVTAGALLAAPALGAKDDVLLISRATGPAGAPADLTSSNPSISAGGDRVAFTSLATNLSAEHGPGMDIFVREAGSSVTTLVSRASGAAGPAADDDSRDPAISGDGRFVAFESDADNLSTDDDNGVANIFVRDLVANTTTLVSRATGAGGAAANGGSNGAAISGDGRHVAFESDGDNLSGADDDAVRNVFVRDLVANTTVLVSRRSGPNGAGGNDTSFAPAISADGTRVAFGSRADNLSTEDDDGFPNVFVRDLTAASTTLISRATGAAGAPAAGGPSNPGAISPSGRFVAFTSAADNLSADDDNAATDVFLRDLDESTTALASRATGPGGAGADETSLFPAVSDNARVAFSSTATNLSAEDTDPFEDVFVRDALADTTELVSRAPGAAGAAANGFSTDPTTSADGRYVAFLSRASNLVAGTVPGVDNIYRRDVLGDAPVATPACKTLPLPLAPPAKSGVVFTLSVTQLRINQRISQAAIRRLNAVEARLNSGLRARDLCGYSIGPAQLGPGIASAPAAASLAAVAPADPAPITDPGRRPGPGDPLTLSAEQLLINQRIDQAGIRRATGITNRLEAGLSGGDIRAAQVTQGKLYDRLQILARAPAAEPPATKTIIPPRRTPPDPDSVTLSTGQLRINQRISQAAVRDANALIRRLETGVSGADLKPATLTAANLG
jgi:Tol biopolymer transport system component